MKRSLLSLAAVAAMFASCSSEEFGGNSVNPGDGEKTYVSFSLNRTMTRAIDPESKLTEANFYVFEAGSLTLLETIKTGPSQSGAMEAAAGPKEVLIVANYAGNKNTLADLPEFAKGSTIATVRAALEGMGVNFAGLPTAITTKLNYANIDTDDATGIGFVMSSSTVIDFPEGGTVAEPKNVFAPIYRAGSKLLVGVDHDAINGSDVRKKIPGTISASRFAVVNTSMETSLGRQYFAGGASPIDPASTTGALKPSTPDYNFTPSVAAPVVAEGSTSYDHLYGYEEMKHATDVTTYADGAWKNAVSATTASGAATLTAMHFLPENIIKGMAVEGSTATGDAAKGEVTYTTVGMIYTPHASEIDKAYTAGASFWAIRTVADKKVQKIGDIAFYTAAADANTAKDGLTTPADYEVVEFKSGKMYYRVDLSNVKFSKSTEKYSVLRNSNYLMDINNINDYGYPGVDDLPGEPTDPVEKNTTLTVTITIIDYTKIASTPDLG